MCDNPANKDGSPAPVTRWDDTNHRLMEVNAAHLVARLCLKHGVRPWFVGRLGLLAGIKGVTTHAKMSKAFKKSTHWDPGTWRRRRFMREVRAHYKYLKSRG
jgi:hypothetical protein